MRKIEPKILKDMDYPSLPLKKFIEKVREIKGRDEDILRVINNAIRTTRDQLEMLKKLKKDLKEN